MSIQTEFICTLNKIISQKHFHTFQFLPLALQISLTFTFSSYSPILFSHPYPFLYQFDDDVVVNNSCPRTHLYDDAIPIKYNTIRIQSITRKSLVFLSRYLVHIFHSKTNACQLAASSSFLKIVSRSLPFIFYPSGFCCYAGI